VSETSDIVTPLIWALNRIPYVWARRIHSGKVRVRGGWMQLGDEGAPDVFVLADGAPVFLEAKATAGKVSAAQAKEHGRIRRCGGTVLVVRSVAEGLQAVTAVLDGLEHRS
jgi:hypothetical protein